MQLKVAPEVQIDQDLTPWVFLNKGKSTAVWISYLNTGIPAKGTTPAKPAPYPLNLFPHMWERHPRILAKPGKPCALPHRYYYIVTRDDSPVQGAEMGMDEAIEQFTPKSLPTDVFAKPKGAL